jgi:hypothetical protein
MNDEFHFSSIFHVDPFEFFGLSFVLVNLFLSLSLSLPPPPLNISLLVKSEPLIVNMNIIILLLAIFFYIKIFQTPVNLTSGGFLIAGININDLKQLTSTPY